MSFEDVWSCKQIKKTFKISLLKRYVYGRSTINLKNNNLPSLINYIMHHKTQQMINVDNLPDINPLAEEKLMLCLKKKVELYTANIKAGDVSLLY